MFRSIGWPELLVLVVAFVVLAVPVWISRKAKPIGPLPYKWGVYVGIQTALAAIGMGFSAFSDFSETLFSQGGFAYLFVVLIAAVAAVGVLRRRRWGAAVSILTLLLAIVLPIMIPTIFGNPTDRKFYANGFRPVMVAAILVANMFYFKKRWPFLNPSL